MERDSPRPHADPTKGFRHSLIQQVYVPRKSPKSVQAPSGEAWDVLIHKVRRVSLLILINGDGYMNLHPWIRTTQQSEGEINVYSLVYENSHMAYIVHFSTGILIPVEDKPDVFL
jgi:hypothetical protein